MEATNRRSGMNVHRMLRALQHRRLCLVLPALILTAGAAIYSRTRPVRYRAQALVAAEAVAPVDFLAAHPETPTAQAVQDQLRTIRETLLSGVVIAPIARDFGQPEASVKSHTQITVDSPGTFFIGFESGRSARQAMEIANRLAEGFVAQTSAARGRKAQEEDRFLDREVDRVRGQLDTQEESIKHYKQRTAQDLPERLSTNLKQIDDLRQQIQHKTDLITENQSKRLAILDEMQALENKGALDADPPEKTAADTALEQARLRLAQLRARYKPNHPEIQRAEKEVRDLEEIRMPAPARRGPAPAYLRYAALKADLASVDQRLQSYLLERRELSTSLMRQEARINSSPGLEAELAQRMHDAALTRTRYEMLFSKQQETKLALRAEKSNHSMAFRIVEAAQLPDAPTGPQPQRLILMALAAGLGIGLAMVAAAEQMDSTFATVEELQDFSTVAVLGAVPSMPSAAGRSGFQRQRLPVVYDPDSVAAEQFQVLSLKVQRALQQSGGQVLMVTSAAGGEGKSVTAINLSLALRSAVAPDGGVLLIDCDMRRPQVHQYLGLDRGIGLADLLSAASGELSDYIVEIHDLAVMPGGAPPENSLGLLASPLFREALARLKKRYRLIVLDCPPVVPIADSHVLAGIADGVLMVVRARQTGRELFRRAVESLDAANLLGVALNDVQYADTSYAYACRYYHRHYLRRR